ncbi:MAG: hypothetical protein ACR2J0_05155 [Mycobacteriales bacterium]
MSDRHRLGTVLATGLLLTGAAACADGARAGGTRPVSPPRADREAAVRGTVVAVTAASITVRRRDGAVHDFRFGLATKVRRHGSDSSVASLAIGDQVSVYGGTGSSSVRRIVVLGAGAGADDGTAG